MRNLFYVTPPDKEALVNAYSFLLNPIGSVDRTFFLVCFGIVLAIIAIYFLIPVFRKSQYEERRENLRKREAAFKHGQKSRLAGETAEDGSCSAENEVVEVKPTSEER